MARQVVRARCGCSSGHTASRRRTYNSSTNDSVVCRVRPHQKPPEPRRTKFAPVCGPGLDRLSKASLRSGAKWLATSCPPVSSLSVSQFHTRIRPVFSQPECFPPGSYWYSLPHGSVTPDPQDTWSHLSGQLPLIVLQEVHLDCLLDLDHSTLAASHFRLFDLGDSRRQDRRLRPPKRSQMTRIANSLEWPDGWAVGRWWARMFFGPPHHPQRESLPFFFIL